MNQQQYYNALASGSFSMKQSPFEYQFYLDESTLTELKLKVTELSNDSIGNKLNQDDLRSIEQYFSQFVAPTYNYNAVQSFIRLLTFSYKAHAGMLKSVLCLMKHQLNSHQEQGVPWRASLCLLIPPFHSMTPPIYPIPVQASSLQPGGVATVSYVQTNKLLFWLKLTSVNNRENQVIFPLRYDGDLNEIQIYMANPSLYAQQQQQQPNNPQFALISSVNAILKRQTTAYQAVNECCMWPAIRDLFQNLQLPSVN